MPFGANLVALPCHSVVLPLPTDREVVADPEVALAVEHRLAARAIPAAVELERQHPGAGREVQVRHERHRAHRLARRDRIELVEQREESLGLVPRIARDRLRPPSACRSERTPVGGVAAAKSLLHASAVTCVTQPASTSASVAKLAIVGVWLLLSGSWMVLPHPPVCEIDEVGHVAGGDPQAERVTLDRGAVEELRVRPHRRDGRHLVDR